MAAVRRTGSLYIDAVRHMRPRQIVGRGRRLIPPAVLAGSLPDPRSAASLPYAAGLGANPAPQSGGSPDPSLTGMFAAFGYQRPAFGRGLWRPGPEGLLFMFHLHGFAPLAGYAAGPRTRAQDEFWARIVESWLEAEARPRLPAWHPHPTSLRLIAWSSALAAMTSWPEGLRSALAREIVRQARYLRRSIEWDVGGNHVLKNATALVFAGATVPAAGVLEPGLRLLRGELARQILADGAHEELSTSYHREVCHDLSQLEVLLDRIGTPSPDWLLSARANTERWQASVAGPGGDLPLLADSWEGPPIAVGSRPRNAVSVLRESGHVVLRSRRDQVVVDCGALCPGHLPAHAHGDALSFVMWADGRPIVVDRGAFAYTGPDRTRFRATAAHSTVEVDGEDQCVFWGDFRASLLPRVEPPQVRACDGITVVESSHDGYRRLRDSVVHHRALLWVPERGVIVVDRLQCRRPHTVRTRLQIAPGVDVRGGRVGPLHIAPLAGCAEVQEAPHAPLLGTRLRARALVAALDARPGMGFGWSLLRGGTTARLGDDGAIEVSRDGERVRVPLRTLDR